MEHWGQPTVQNSISSCADEMKKQMLAQIGISPSFLEGEDLPDRIENAFRTQLFKERVPQFRVESYVVTFVERTRHRRGVRIDLYMDGTLIPNTKPKYYSARIAKRKAKGQIDTMITVMEIQPTEPVQMLTVKLTVNKREPAWLERALNA